MDNFDKEATVIDKDKNVVSVGTEIEWKGIVDKIDSNNVTLWQKTLDGQNDLRAIAVDGTGNYIVAGCARVDHKNHAMVVKFDSEGTLLWQKILQNGSRNELFYGVTTDASNNYIAVGISYAFKTEDREENRECGALIAEFDSHGNLLCRKKTGKNFYLDSVTAVSDNSYLVTGRKFKENHGWEAVSATLDGSLNFV